MTKQRDDKCPSDTVKFPHEYLIRSFGDGEMELI